MTKILYRNFEKSFLECEKMASRNIFWDFVYADFSMFASLVSNRTVFSLNLELICPLEFLKEAEILGSTKSLVQFQLFEKLTQRNKSSLFLSCYIGQSSRSWTSLGAEHDPRREQQQISDQTTFYPREARSSNAV